MSQFIPLDKAVAMTSLYRKEKDTILAEPFKGKNILCISETFERGVIDALLAKPGCEAIRIYYGMDDQLKVHAILVAVNAKNEDILPVAAGKSGVVTEEEGDVVEEGKRCPDDCGSPSPLNP